VILEGEELIISTFLATNGRSSLDEIAMECHLPLSKVAGLLIQLELKDIITPLPGKEFEVKHAF
jgi:DNA processing protein